MNRQKFPEKPADPKAEAPFWRQRRRIWGRPEGAQMAVCLLALVLLPSGLRAGLTGREGDGREDAVVKADSQLEAAAKQILMGRKGDRTEEEEEGEEEEGEYVTIGPEEDENMGRDNGTVVANSESPLVLREARRRQYFISFDGGAPSTQAHISLDSWERYERFKEETCRKGRGMGTTTTTTAAVEEEEYLAERPLNNTQSGYFHWEANEFHRQLRDRLLPQTRGGSFSSLIGSPLLSRLDPRLFVSEPRSLCKAKRHISEADERQKLAKEEQHMFEDFLINKVLPPHMFAPRRPSPAASNGNGTRRAEL